MSRLAKLALSALTGAAFALRLLDLLRFELFVDEAATWWFAGLTAAGRLAEQISLEPTPPLYYAVVGLLMKLFGESDLVLRLPSAVFGAAAVPVVFALGRALFGLRVGWIAACLLAVHPLHVFYSREARVYPLLLCLTMVALLALWRALQDGATSSWGCFTAALILVCYSHVYGLFLALAAVVSILCWSRDRRARWRGLMATSLALLAFSPYGIATFPHLKESGAAWSIETFTRDYPEEQRLGRVFETQLIGADYHPYLRQLDRPETPSLLRASSVLAQLLLLLLALRFAARHGRWRELGFLLLIWLTQIMVPWSITHFGRAIFHAGRHDVYALGSLCVLLAVGFAGLVEPAASGRSRRGSRLALAAAIAVAVLGGAVFRLVSLHRIPVSGDQRRAGEWIAKHSGPDDRVIAMGIRRLVTQHATRLAGGVVPFESFPASTDSHPGWSDVMTLIEDQELLHREARGRIAELGRSLPADGSLFLLLRPYQRAVGSVSATWLVDRHMLENLHAAGWRPVPELRLRQARIEAFRPPGPAARAPGGSYEE